MGILSRAALCPFIPLTLLPPCSSMNSPQGAAFLLEKKISAPAWVLHRLQQVSVFATGAPLPPFSLTLVFTLLFLTLSGIYLSAFPLPVWHSLPFYRDAINLCDGLSCVLWWIHCRAGRSWQCLAQRQPVASSHRGSPCSPPTANTFPWTPNRARNYFLSLYLQGKLGQYNNA